ncbi:hypothetical protein HanHA300_Chr17g0670121 [Helianthus annuus]|nr:hypothetical protein HanHA300_Chr17g0670121 [Helianthus annuus]KAJ0448955.1 hypothetical protein HanHA89_Chr17g0722921 [Helianthus annuus]KAJ0633830.1 hypothetical protein HanLR1_Chr17g0681281 [Helianthus annuus]
MCILLFSRFQNIMFYTHSTLFTKFQNYYLWLKQNDFLYLYETCWCVIVFMSKIHSLTLIKPIGSMI